MTGLSRPIGDADNRHGQQSIDLLDDSPATVTVAVVRNRTLPTGSYVLAAAVVLGGVIWLLTPALGSVEEPDPMLGPSRQRTTVESDAGQEHAAGSDLSNPFALANEPGGASLVDRIASEARHCQLITNKPSLDHAFPLGAPQG